MKALIPTDFLHKHLSGQGIGAIIKAALLGAPLPLCSCGVIPAAIGLRKAGASKPATASFLVSTPETGVDSISITYAMMGGFMAIVRPIAALISAIVAGLLVGLFDREDAKESCDTATHAHSHTNAANCCASKEAVEPSCCSSQPVAEQSCCGSASPTPRTSFINKAWEGIHYAFTQLLNDIALWLFIGMLFAAAVKTFMPPDFLAQWGQGLPAMLIMLLAGIPMYICATASTPVAAGLMLAGVSPGVALVLLLTGPATNISTLGVIHKEMGSRSMWLYLAGTSITALLAGLLVDAIVQNGDIDMIAQLHEHHESLPAVIAWGALVLLILLVLYNKLKK
jgi:uncharacterized membrane protein YraQ (UPF0718 family)